MITNIENQLVAAFVILALLRLLCSLHGVFNPEHHSTSVLCSVLCCWVIRRAAKCVINRQANRIISAIKRVKWQHTHTRGHHSIQCEFGQ